MKEKKNNWSPKVDKNNYMCIVFKDNVEEQHCPSTFKTLVHLFPFFLLHTLVILKMDNFEETSQH